MKAGVTMSLTEKVSKSRSGAPPTQVLPTKNRNIVRMSFYTSHIAKPLEWDSNSLQAKGF